MPLVFEVGGSGSGSTREELLKALCRATGAESVLVSPHSQGVRLDFDFPNKLRLTRILIPRPTSLRDNVLQVALRDVAREYLERLLEGCV